MSILPARLIVLDTETTGFPRHDWSRVIELGAVALDLDGNEVSSFASLVCPDILDDRATKALEINHIEAHELRSAPPTTRVVPDFRAWAASTGARYVTSFNVGFDRPMVARMGLDLSWASCVMERAMDVMGPAGALPAGPYGGWKWPKLSEAAEFFGVAVEGDAHRALTDARTAARIAVAIKRSERGAA